MTINKIEVSLFLSESALSKYPIKRPTIIFEKRRILAWQVTYGHVYPSRLTSISVSSESDASIYWDIFGVFTFTVRTIDLSYKRSNSVVWVI